MREGDLGFAVEKFCQGILCQIGVRIGGSELRRVHEIVID